jgi:hypothetical protein
VLRENGQMYHLQEPLQAKMVSFLRCLVPPIFLLLFHGWAIHHSKGFMTLHSLFLEFEPCIQSRDLQHQFVPK